MTEELTIEDIKESLARKGDGYIVMYKREIVEQLLSCIEEQKRNIIQQEHLIDLKCEQIKALFEALEEYK